MDFLNRPTPFDNTFMGESRRSYEFPGSDMFRSLEGHWNDNMFRLDSRRTVNLNESIGLRQTRQAQHAPTNPVAQPVLRRVDSEEEFG